MDARRMNASALWLRFSQSLASRRQRPSQPMVRSTIPFGQHEEAFGLIATADDLSGEERHGVRQTVMKHRPGIGAVGKQLLEERELSEQGGQNHDAAVAILNIGGGHQRVQQQTQRIDQNVPLLALDQFAAIKPVRIDARPPFSALLTLWLSMMQAVRSEEHTSELQSHSD